MKWATKNAGKNKPEFVRVHPRLFLLAQGGGRKTGIL